jgi:hypothetical protein
VFDNRVLRGIFGPKRKKWQNAGEDWIMRTYTSYINRVVKLRLMRFVGYVIRMADIRNTYRILAC